MINLFSDTQTLPSEGMRAAIASANVGDEQRFEDPTTLALEERVAELLQDHPEARRLHLALSGLGRIDVSGGMHLDALVEDARAAGLEVELSDPPPQATAMLNRARHYARSLR